MYIPSFSYLAQFGGELYEEQIQKKIEKDQKPFFGLWQVEMGMKSRDSQKANQNSYLMYKLDFSFFAQFGGELCEEQAKKIRKKHQKPTSLGFEKVKWGQKVGYLKKHISNYY